MKQVLKTIISATFLFLSSCVNKNNQAKNNVQTISKLQDNIITATTIDKAYVGMDINELKKAYRNYQFIDTPAYYFGIDGEEKDLVIAKDDVPQLFVWTSFDQKVNGLYSLTSNFYTDNNLKVGMTIKEVKNSYPNCEIAVDVMDVNLEYIYIQDKGVRLCFMTNENRIGIYKDLDAVELSTNEFKSDTFRVQYIATTK